MSRDRDGAHGRPRAFGRASVSAPANLLLLGEYAVLEEGGLGLAVAPDVRAKATLAGPRAAGRGEGRDRPAPPVSPADTDNEPVVRGRMPGGEVRWPGDPGVLGRVADYLLETVGPAPGDVEVDTSAFFRADGRKRGYGSSASLTVALTALWTGFEHARADRERVRRIATEAHRAAQGGRGSGYDVAVSSIGGVVLFTGGERPEARRVALPWLPPVSLFEGPDPVATTDAVGRYREWCGAHPGEAGAFLERSNELVVRFATAPSWAEAREVLLEYRELTLDLGGRIGVPADIEPPASIGEEGIGKAVGAGNELGVILAPGTAPDRAVGVAEEGYRWE